MIQPYKGEARGGMVLGPKQYVLPSLPLTHETPTDRTSPPHTVAHAVRTPTASLTRARAATLQTEEDRSLSLLSKLPLERVLLFPWLGGFEKNR